MDQEPIARVASSGFQGHGCAFCGMPIPVGDAEQFPMRVDVGGRGTWLWAHRTCLCDRVIPNVRRALEQLPPAAPDDVWPRRSA